MTAIIEYSLGVLADLLEVELRGDPDTLVSGLATLSTAKPGQLSFYHNSRYYSDLLKTEASVVIVHPKEAELCSSNVLLSTQPYITYARISQLFEQKLGEKAGIHPSANIDSSAVLGKDIEISANVVIAADVIIGDGVSIGPNCVIGHGSQIAAGGVLHANVTIAHGVRIGKRVTIFSSSVIGGDGFGYAFDGERYVKIAQLGGVLIGDDVDIGAGSCIDRGALDDTVIGNGVKIDNQVQIAHNVIVGEHTVICGCSAIAGSSTIGKKCTIAGGVGIINHIDIADEVTVTAMSLVNQSISQKGVYSSGTALVETKQWKKNIVHFKKLEDLFRRLKRLEKK